MGLVNPAQAPRGKGGWLLSHRNHRNHRKGWLKPAPVAALHAEGAGDSGDDCGKEFQYLGNVIPIYFYHKAKIKF